MLRISTRRRQGRSTIEAQQNPRPALFEDFEPAEAVTLGLQKCRNILRPWLCRFEPNLRIGLGQFLWGELLCADANWPDRFGSARLRFTRFIGSTGSTGSSGSSVRPVHRFILFIRFIRFRFTWFICSSSIQDPGSQILDPGSWIWIQDP